MNVLDALPANGYNIGEALGGPPWELGWHVSLEMLDDLYLGVNTLPITINFQGG